MRGVTCDRFVLQKMWSFLLTRLMRGVTAENQRLCEILTISTHTPHARRDMAIRVIDDTILHFYSHASCEA